MTNSSCRQGGWHSDGGSRLSWWCAGTVEGWTGGITAVDLGQLTSERWQTGPSIRAHNPPTELTPPTPPTWGQGILPPRPLPQPGDLQPTNQKAALPPWSFLNVVLRGEAWPHPFSFNPYPSASWLAHSDITQLTACFYVELTFNFFSCIFYIWFILQHAAVLSNETFCVTFPLRSLILFDVVWCSSCCSDVQVCCDITAGGVVNSSLHVCR